MTPGTLLSLAPAAGASAAEIVATARDCSGVGAAVLVLPAGAPALRGGAATEVVRTVRAETGLLVQLCAGGSPDPADLLDAAPDAVSVPLGEPGAAQLAALLRERGVPVVFAASDLAHLAVLARLTAQDRSAVHVELLLGRPGGLPGTMPALAACLPLLPPGASFSAAGAGDSALPVMLAALSAGGHLRVGRADTPAYAPGSPVRDDVQLVARAAGLARIAQRPPLSPGAARTLLGLGSGRPDAAAPDLPVPDPTVARTSTVEAAP